MQSPELTNQIMQRIDALAAKLGVTAQYIFSVYVAQAKVEAIRDAATSFGCLLGIVAMVFAWKRLLKIEDLDVEIMSGAGVSTAIAGALCAVFFCIGLYSAIGEWLNPQYWALDALFHALGGGAK